MAATATTLDVSTSDVTLFTQDQDGGPCMGVHIFNRDTTRDLSVIVYGMHATYQTIIQSKDEVFIAGSTNAITKVVAKYAQTPTVTTSNVTCNVVARA